MGIIINLEELDRYLGKVEAVFDTELIMKQEVTNESIIKYYEESEFGYHAIHSAEGSIHMALNFDGSFSKDGYYEQGRTVNRQLTLTNAKKILELASGNGFNSIFLAQNNPDVNFEGIDLSPSHVAMATKKADELNLKNVCFNIESFQSLSFPEKLFDILFEVESICHASDMRLALTEAYRVLKPNGRFILFDGFRKRDFEKLSPNIRRASKLVEISMAVGKGIEIDKWLALAHEAGFIEVEVSEISEAIMPNLKRFQRLARGYFKYSRVANVILQQLPPELVMNSIAGLLMPFTISLGAQGYYRIVLEK
ncbi:MAG: class I SAM-dependent methyltransferase [Chloroflexi bacterium]|nr:class I SAM-dependent methyltransferase [Chloroflexota bacterium]